MNDERERSIEHGKQINRDIAERPEAYDNREQAEHATEYVLAQINADLKAENEKLTALNAELVAALVKMVVATDTMSCSGAVMEAVYTARAALQKAKQ